MFQKLDLVLSSDNKVGGKYSEGPAGREVIPNLWITGTTFLSDDSNRLFPKLSCALVISR
jgi:hypothetical protein